jgi:hypothetical protein
MPFRARPTGVTVAGVAQGRPQRPRQLVLAIRFVQERGVGRNRRGAGASFNEFRCSPNSYAPFGNSRFTFFGEIEPSRAVAASGRRGVACVQ